MELLTALLTEKWILSAVLFAGYVLQHRERVEDKRRYSESLEAFADKMDVLAKALTSLEGRIK